MTTRLSIAGDIGSGKTTVAQLAAEFLGVRPLSTGGIQRQLASQRGITTLELNRLAENDPSIDQEIDRYLQNLPAGDLVVESRMAWHFVPNTKKVFLYILHQEAASRVVKARRQDEGFSSIDDAMQSLRKRRLSEVTRFNKYYGVNIDDIRNYDIIIDTTRVDARKIADIIIDTDIGSKLPLVLLNPVNLIPTQSIRELSSDEVGELAALFRANENYDRPSVPAIQAIYANHNFYIVDGHNRAASAIKAQLDHIPVEVEAFEGEDYRPGLSVKQYIADSVTDSKIYDWEDALNFKYEYEIWRNSTNS